MKRVILMAFALIFSLNVAFGQAISVNGGAVEGTITDPSGASIPNATVVVTNPDTGYTKEVHTDGAGFYTVGPLAPGNYKIRVVAPNFSELAVSTVVRTGTVTPGTFKLRLGKSSEVVEVNAGSVLVNTEQIQVADVITQEQIDTLPVNGRNFLDVAQIEPGVILQQGSSFDPTKTGYSAISVGGVGGRSTRILLDGQDITDEFVGTTIMNVSQGSIGEFQLNRSTQDVSGEVTTTGQVLVSTRSGTNRVHGMAFYNFQDARALFAAQNIPTNNVIANAYPNFQRNQYGGSVGGPILKDKLFYFLNLERIQQKQAAGSGIGPNFVNTVGATYANYNSPYKEEYMAGRIDYHGPFGGTYFVRGAYNFNGAIGNSGRNFQLFTNRDNTYGFAGGADFQRGRMTHSFRGSYEKFHNFIGDAAAGNNSIYNPIPSLTIYYATQTLWTGPNPNAPQGTFQSDKQFRYDGTLAWKAHQFKFGGAMNRIQSAAFAAFYGLAARATITDAGLLDGTVATATAQNPLKLGCNGVVGAAPCKGDLINGYNTTSTVFGNNQGFGTNETGFGLPGGASAGWRASGYLGDSWKVRPNLTVTAGVRWSVDTNRENNDLDPATCGDISAKFAAAGASNPCNGKPSTYQLFNLWNPSASYSGRVHQPYGNFAPQVGFNFSPGDHKTSIRGGAGIYYESVVFNNTDNARGNLLKFSRSYVLLSTMCTAGTLTFPDGNVYQSIGISNNQLSTAPAVAGSTRALPDLCKNLTVAQAAPAFNAIERAYQSATLANSSVASGGYIGTTMSASGLYAPNYRTPYAEQWNFGVQRELFKGAVLSVDYVHSATLKIGQTNDINHMGAARNLNTTNANAAVAATITACGGTTLAGILAPGGCPGISGRPNGATLTDFATRGLDSQGVYNGNSPFVYNNKTMAGAFTGDNPLLGSGAFLQPIGKSAYDALQAVFRAQKTHPLPFVDSGNLQISYSLSRAASTTAGSSDQFFTNGALDKYNPTAYFGRNALDHTHAVNIGGAFTFKYGPRLGLIAHFYSAIPATLSLDTAQSSGGIFQTDLTGDGTVGDIAPGTSVGGYMHDIKGKDLQNYINNFNATRANTLTPAGQALVTAGIFTQAQMVALKAAVQPIANLPQGKGIENPTIRSMDVNFAYPIRFHKLFSAIPESITLEPSIAFYNVGNFSNFGGAPTFTSVVSGVLTNTTTAGGSVNNIANTVNGSNSFATVNPRRTLRGTGTFDQGAPRSAEFGLKLNF